MADPLSAISLAGSIIQFVEFGTKLVSNSIEIYNSTSGSIQEHKELEMMAKNLEQQILIIKNTPTAIEDEAMSEMLDGCKSLSKALQLLLDQIRVAPDRRGRIASLKASGKAALKRNELENLARRLERMRDSICAHLNFLTFNHRTEMERFLGQLGSLGIQPPRPMAQPQLGALTTQVATMKNLLVTAAETGSTKRFKWEIDSESKVADVYHSFAESFGNSVKDMEWNRRIYSIVSSLQFPQIKERESIVLRAYQSTFEWAFDGSKTNFAHWLRTGAGIYWISGRAGSGKSTLVKFLLAHGETRKALRTWAKQDQLVVASHYFWNQGTKLQRSPQGLFRTLLFAILVQQPKLVPLIAPERWDSELKAGSEWTADELYECFNRLPEAASSIGVRICLFVDGLDEYEGDHERLVATLGGIALSDNCKICASSRPWVEFTSAFGTSEWKLQVQDMTRDDIATYVRENLETHSHFKFLSREYGKQASALINQITETAQGVFLWVYLVVRSLIRGMNYKDSISDLVTRLNDLPADLTDYFQVMMDSIEDIYKQRTAKIFKTLALSESGLPVITFHFVDLEADDPDYAFGPLKSPSGRLMFYRTAQMLKQHQIVAQCKDLVHITENKDHENTPWSHTAQFLHRTVADFFKTPIMDALLTKRTGQGFDARLSLCRASLAQMRVVRRYRNWEHRFDAVKPCLLTILQNAAETETAYGRPECEILPIMGALLSEPNPLEAMYRGWDRALKVPEAPDEQQHYLVVLARMGLRCFVLEALREPDLSESVRLDVLVASLRMPYTLDFELGHLVQGKYNQEQLQLIRDLLMSGTMPDIWKDGRDEKSPWRALVGWWLPSDIKEPNPASYQLLHLMLSFGAVPTAGDWNLMEVSFAPHQSSALKNCHAKALNGQLNKEPDERQRPGVRCAIDWNRKNRVIALEYQLARELYLNEALEQAQEDSEVSSMVQARELDAQRRQEQLLLDRKQDGGGGGGGGGCEEHANAAAKPKQEMVETQPRPANGQPTLRDKGKTPTDSGPLSLRPSSKEKRRRGAWLRCC
ncbi:hypothetical protein B0T24DRAFT_666047 [Lasiosphaeria ovina]|uniref:NACHT domain-containing protein n=1 Tax=Lasiosphaeria ovina TaxID=92902 RepID=A0AAE0KJ73_9PEZI|nr:hypothetical protein B0T24DRAFT_666047 [Lasiosphaeria ovina]